jgi:hypothetical protein
MAAEEVRMCRVDIAGLHTGLRYDELVFRDVFHIFVTHATMSETSFVVGVIEFLKKLITTALNLSLKAGNRRNACYKQHP